MISFGGMKGSELDVDEVIALSKSAVTKAGSKVRKIHCDLENGLIGHDEANGLLNEPLRTIALFRKTFAVPLASVNMSLRAFLSTSGVNGEVSQRLKRMETIIDKISSREKKLDLLRMRDIGGCRIVIDSNDLEDLYSLLEHLISKLGNEVEKVIDYVDQPRSSGYRAVHIIMKRNDRLIEVQLRTSLMHSWAELAEAFSQIVGKNFKQDGDTPIHRLMLNHQEINICVEGKEVVPDNLLKEQALLNMQVDALLNELMKEA